MVFFIIIIIIRKVNIYIHICMLFGWDRKREYIIFRQILHTNIICINIHTDQNRCNMMISKNVWKETESFEMK